MAQYQKNQGKQPNPDILKNFIKQTSLNVIELQERLSSLERSHISQAKTIAGLIDTQGSLARAVYTPEQAASLPAPSGNGAPRALPAPPHAGQAFQTFLKKVTGPALQLSGSGMPARVNFRSTAEGHAFAPFEHNRIYAALKAEAGECEEELQLTDEIYPFMEEGEVPGEPAETAEDILFDARILAFDHFMRLHRQFLAEAVVIQEILPTIDDEILEVTSSVLESYLCTTFIALGGQGPASADMDAPLPELARSRPPHTEDALTTLPELAGRISTGSNKQRIHQHFILAIHLHQALRELDAAQELLEHVVVEDLYDPQDVEHMQALDSETLQPVAFFLSEYITLMASARQQIQG